MREHLRIAIAYLRDQGATQVEIRPGGKHGFLCFNWRGCPKSYVVAISPSDSNTRHLIVGDLRRLLGIGRGEKPAARPHHELPASPRRPAQPVPLPKTFTPLPDWREPLYRLMERL